MNKNNYVWVFSSAALGNGIKGAFSLEYNIPVSKLKVDPKALVGSRVWLVMRDGAESFLYAMITASSIETYKEGRYKNDVLLNAGVFLSVRFLPRHESREPWKLHIFPENEEIRECADAELTTFQEIVKQNHRVSFSPPSNVILDSVPHTIFTDLEHAVPDQLTSTLRTVALGDVAQIRSYPSEVSALGGIALTILKLSHPNLDEADIVALITALDPMGRMAKTSDESRQKISKVLSSLPPIVDTFLEEIDPEKISPRTFVAATPNFSPEWLDKTSDAEQEHEKILKDLVLQLKNKGYAVYKSSSFDVFAERGGVRTLWEIKSANNLNSLAQGEKGIIQLLRYSTALSSDSWKGVNFSLLLQDSEQPALQDYLRRMSEQTGVHLWLYNEHKDWPERVYSLKNGTRLPMSL